MSKYMAVIDEQNKVLNVLICDELEPETPTLIAYNDTNPAFIGGDYFEGYFYPPKPFDSWHRSAGVWEPPTPMPNSIGNWQWNELEQKWED
jgi:hypothetical protein